MNDHVNHNPPSTIFVLPFLTVYPSQFGYEHMIGKMVISFLQIPSLSVAHGIPMICLLHHGNKPQVSTATANSDKQTMNYHIGL
jgi:hypothetical protein